MGGLVVSERHVRKDMVHESSSSSSSLIVNRRRRDRDGKFSARNLHKDMQMH